MFGAIYIGLSGLGSYSDGLQAVSNNVSNLNTVGFKANDVTFQNVFGAGSQGGLEFGNSPKGSGYGVSLDELSINFSQGELRQTGRDLDLSIDGNGFFVLIDGDQQFFARTGSFVVDDEGFIVLQNTDFRLGVLDEEGRPKELNIDEFRTDPPEATTRVTFADNLSSTADDFTIPDLTVFGPNGEENNWTVQFERDQDEVDTWTVTVTNGSGTELGSETLIFANGEVSGDTTELSFEDEDEGLSVTFDFSEGVTSFSSGTVSSLRASDVEGHSTGSLATLAVNEQGQLEITYTNEETLELGSVALADFRDPQSLEQRGNALFEFNGFGQVQFLGAEDTRVGSILSRRLEASNVDLGNQFGDLILIQRGFQASSQIISVSNDMIQQLFGIRGQG
ncbi:flagellar hook-basal body complex protein [uncultured Erythrobacter sp.]|uniref:flagellar hook-basal body complex protein n=1 Tax=uncultured Erythrobacter sp. TaxID=263913 RepID=UPI00261A42CA|nr:flagellar hook-basal body complex protein [uncultured Erythrobacter sp.]